MSYDISTIISILSGFLLVISESLPFFKNLNSNGIMHLLVNLGQNKTTILEEIEPFLNANTNTNEQREREEHINVNDKLDNINNTLSCMTNKIYDSLNNVIDNSRTLKLQPSELYELNYIINYIKNNYPKKLHTTRFLSKTSKQLLISQGYIIDYDVQHDTYTIKW